MSKRFFSTPDFLLVLSSQINHKETLYNLCLVSRLFNRIFTEKLYDKLEFNRQNVHHLRDKEKCDLFVRHNKLIYCKTIAISYNKIDLICPGYNWESEYHAWRQINRNLANMIMNGSNLSSFINENTLLTRESMEHLLSAHKLRRLAISLSLHTRNVISGASDTHAGNAVAREKRLRRAKLELSVLHEFLPQFGTLQSLSITNIMGDLKKWKDTIVDVLVGNPQLEQLSLSIYDEWSLWHAGGSDAPTSYDGKLFERICTSYAQKTNMPLRLKTLELGKLVYFPSLERLSSLTAVEHLEAIYTHNVPRHIAFDMPWDLLQPLATPRLRHLSLQYLDENICEGIKNILRAGRQIDIFEAFEFDDEMPDDDKEGRCISNLFTDEPILKARQVLLPGAGPNLYGKYGLRSLQSCSWITHLVVPIGVEPGEEESPEELRNLLLPVYNMVGGMASLEAIWLPNIHCGEDELEYQTGDKKRRLEGCEPYLRAITDACATVKYVQFEMSRWLVHRITGSAPPCAVFEELDEWEGEFDGPAFFQVTDPKSWPQYY